MKSFFQIILALLLCHFGRAEAAKPSMTRIVSRFFGPEIQPGSFAAKPRTLYIAGSSYSRTEEESDPEHGIHGLLIANEPNVWIINLLDHSGRHIVDPGPTYIVSQPILEREAGKEFASLQFGNEVAFFLGTRQVPCQRARSTACVAMGLSSRKRLIESPFTRDPTPMFPGNWR